MRRSRLPYLLLVAAAASAGAFYAWIDARPGWDDTGVLAGLVFASALVCGVAAPKRPWVWALLVGGWIPLAALVRSGSAAALAAPLVGALGAYGGAGMRRLLDGGAA